MKTTLTLVLGAALLTSAACSRSGHNLRRDQQNYEVIQEGSASGVSSTISAPGETPPPLPALTGTNADTTTAFTLPSTTIPTTSGQPGTIAGTLPQPDSYPRTPRPRPVAPQPEPQPPVVHPPAMTDTTSTAPADAPKPPETPPENPPATTTTQ